MLNENLKAYRKAKGLTQDELAIRLNIVRQTVSKWETGLSVPDADILIKIADVFDVTVSELLGAKVESEKDIGDIAVQLSRSNEKLTIINRRARVLRKAAPIALSAVLIAGAFIWLITAAGFNSVQPAPPPSPSLAQTPQQPSSPGLVQAAHIHAGDLPNDGSSYHPANFLGLTYGVADYAKTVDELPDLIFTGMDEHTYSLSFKERVYISKSELLRVMPEKGQTAYINDLQIKTLGLYNKNKTPLDGQALSLLWHKNISNARFFDYLLPAVRDLFGEFIYRVNDSGVTYGRYFDVNLTGSYPALIEAMAADGTVGYISADDLIGAPSISGGHPTIDIHGEGAISFFSKWPSLHSYPIAGDEWGSVPLYAPDGVTVIGEILVVTGVRYDIRLEPGNSRRFDDFELPGYYAYPDAEQSWASSDADVFVTNPENNEITATGAGTAMLTITAGEITHRFLVFVT